MEPDLNFVEDELEDFDVTSEDAAGVLNIDQVPATDVCIDTAVADLEAPTSWVAYSDRGPNDVVLSGPVIGGWGPGRWHQNRRIAFGWAIRKYGIDRVVATPQSNGRWSVLIKNLKED